MAINPRDESVFDGKIDETDLTNYPYGKPRDITTPGDGTGTPWEQVGIREIWGMQQRLLTLAGITPNGNSETAQASQYVEAIQAVARGSVTTLFENESGIGNGMTVDWASTGFTLDDFDLIMLRAVTSNNVTGGGGDVFATFKSDKLVGFGNLAIGESARSGGAEGYAYVGVSAVTQTTLNTRVIATGATYDADFIGIYGVKL